MRCSGYCRRHVVESMDHEQNTIIIWGRWGRTGARAFSRGDQSPNTRSPSMTDERLAFKIINYSDARVPEPSPKLYETMALKAWVDYKDHMELHVGHEMPDWDELPSKLKGVWIAIARGQHGVITLLGGGKTERIDAK